jgi:hypothetical protein
VLKEPSLVPPGVTGTAPEMPENPHAPTSTAIVARDFNFESFRTLFSLLLTSLTLAYVGDLESHRRGGSLETPDAHFEEATWNFSTLSSKRRCCCQILRRECRII